MKFTESKDGAMRASVSIKFRIDLSDLATAITIRAMGINANNPTINASEVVAKTTKKQAEEEVRTLLYVHGPSPQWPEDYSDDFEYVLEEANARAEELYG